MSSEDMESKEIYKQFHGEKIIFGIKNPHFNITFIKSYYWLFPFVILPTAIAMLLLLPSSERIFAYLLASIAILLSTLGFLSQFYRLYFDENDLILENKLHKRTVISFNQPARLYVIRELYKSFNPMTRCSTTESLYNLHIEQGSTTIVLDVTRIGNHKIALFLDSIQTKEKQDSDHFQYQDSSNNAQKNFSDYVTFLYHQGNILDVKNSSQTIKISNSPNLKKAITTCTLLSIISFVLEYGLNFIFPVSNDSIFRSLFLSIGVFLALFDFFLIITLLDRGKDLCIKISYPSIDSIKINNYLLNYKVDPITIDLESIKSSLPFEKYNYLLTIYGQTHSYHIKLALQDIQPLIEFIDNLVFEPKK